VQGILSVCAMDLESKYCYFYHSWDFVPYNLLVDSFLNVHDNLHSILSTYVSDCEVLNPFFKCWLLYLQGL